MSSHTSTETLSTVERSFKIVRKLCEMEGARITELSEEMDTAPSTVHKYLATLAQEGFVVKEGDVYYVGLGFLDLGSYARNRKQGYQLGREKAREIADETGERAQFVVEEHGKGIYLHTDASNPRAVFADRRTGIRRYLHSSASGKAILAHLPEYRVDEIIDEYGLPAETEHTITDRGTLFEELEQIQEDGIAYNDEESVAGLRAVGVPVEGANGLLLGSLSVSGPSRRLTDSLYWEEIPDLLLGHANEMELKVNYS